MLCFFFLYNINIVVVYFNTNNASQNSQNNPLTRRINSRWRSQKRHVHLRRIMLRLPLHVRTPTSSTQGDNKNAPSLGGLIGRQAGSTEFRYSKAMKTAGFRWSPKHLFVYLQNPAKYVRGNKMAYTGLKREQDRADLIAFLVRYRP